MAKTGCLLIVFASTLASALSAGACPQGWIYHGNSCYFFEHSNFTWDGAMTHCKILGGTLAEVTTESEKNFIQQQARNLNYHNRYWIGGIDSEVEGEWIWASSKTKITFSDWAPRQPDNVGDSEDCLEIGQHYHWKWNDVHCGTPEGFICEKRFDVLVIG